MLVAPSPPLSFPFHSFTPHYAQYVDPLSGNVSKIIVVPSAMAMSWQDGECGGCPGGVCVWELTPPRVP